MIWARKITPEEINQRWLKGLGAFMGIEVLEVGEDFIKAWMPVNEKTIQPFNKLHGGASCALGETLGSVASNFCIKEEGLVAVGQSLSAYHLRPVNQGEDVTGIVRAKHLGRRSHVWEIKISNQDGKPVCEILFATALVAIA